jgi:hypothetical protein
MRSSATVRNAKILDWNHDPQCPGCTLTALPAAIEAVQYMSLRAE